MRDKPNRYRRIKWSRIAVFISAVVLFFAVLILLPETVAWPARSTIAIMLFGLILWAFAPIPIDLTSIIILILLMVMKGTEMDVILSGFASPAVFLIIGGMMMAMGVNQTLLVKRMTYFLLSRMGGSAKGIYTGFFILMQIQAFFIPATAVRASLMVPILSSIIEETGVDKQSNFNKLMYIGAAFGGSVSGIVVLTAAIGNILAVEILRLYVGVSISYLQWFIYAAPVWLMLVLATMYIVWKCYPPEAHSFERLQNKMKGKYQSLGHLTVDEKKCTAILIITILIWFTESWHGYHPTFGALLAVVLMSLPATGFADWKKMLDINFGMVLLIGATLSLGYSLIESGAIDLLEVLISPQIVLDTFSNPWLAIPITIILSQVYHLGVTNVSTAVITLMPVLISLSVQAGVDPVVIVITSAIAMLLGFLLVVETMPNVVVHGTGQVSQKDFLWPGLWLTLASIVIMIVIAYTYWRWIGFWP
ncbi:SLC13 family permease [Salinicoccus hispanicus]|uniref:Sodium-dependent dicarboxylate transporter SdcS n=1 Tax=Salinicoccus hispanicus TaxID=157225 RepID=A0A6N8U0E8_9STAP|nr:DASS family sodium-coupled anion symporter [Salinicoccus hispanicus]MXQ51232.1 DASS family sodium-coupled anion symporter [Salinicoccus hispanicus]